MTQTKTLTVDELMHQIKSQDVRAYIVETTNPQRIRRGQGKVEFDVEFDVWNEIRIFLPILCEEFTLQGKQVKFQDGPDNVTITLK